jgi:putative addiction module killer protein
MVYSDHMPEVVQSETFSQWLSKLADGQAKARIVARASRLAMGNPGDVKPAGGGISEMRIDYGPGYRVYFVQRGPTAVLLCGGDKRTQSADIKQAAAIAKDWPSDAAPTPEKPTKGAQRGKGKKRPRE